VNIIVAVKQIPGAESLLLGPTGRLQREGFPLEMSAYCRRAVAKGVELAHKTSGRCTVVSLGPPSATDVLREALAWGADEAVLLSDPVFAGSDTFVTARALAALIKQVDQSFDLVLVGKASLDAETGQVGPQLAELLDLPFASAVRELEMLPNGQSARLRCEQDDGGCEMSIQLPAVLAVAERLCQPTKVAPDIWAEIPPSRVRHLAADDLGVPGPWGEAASPTVVTALEFSISERSGFVCSGSVTEQVHRAVALLEERGALDYLDTDLEERDLSETVQAISKAPADTSKITDMENGTVLIAVLIEPNRSDLAQELLGAAASIAHDSTSHVVGIIIESTDIDQLAAFGADEVVAIVDAGSNSLNLVEQDIAAVLSQWTKDRLPDIILAPATYWGREIASRVAARLEAGLIGDVIGMKIVSGKLQCTKPTFGGSQIATIIARSKIQLATLRPGMMPKFERRLVNHKVPYSEITALGSDHITIASRWRDDDLEALVRAPAVIGVGAAVLPEYYGEIQLLAKVIEAEIGATRKVTDQGWLPKSRQIGITGQSIAPSLYVAVGTSGKLNHLIGVRRAGTVLAINTDPGAFVFGGCDIGIVGEWREVVQALAQEIETRFGI